MAQRPATRSAYANQFISSVVGHVELGETFEEAARRELREELGIETRLERLGKFSDVSLQGNIAHKVIYVLFVGVCHDAAVVRADPEEAQALQWLDLAELEQDIRIYPERYALPLRRNPECYLRSCPQDPLTP